MVPSPKNEMSSQSACISFNLEVGHEGKALLAVSKWLVESSGGSRGVGCTDNCISQKLGQTALGEKSTF